MGALRGGATVKAPFRQRGGWGDFYTYTYIYTYTHPELHANPMLR